MIRIQVCELQLYSSCCLWPKIQLGFLLYGSQNIANALEVQSDTIGVMCDEELWRKMHLNVKFPLMDIIYNYNFY